MGWLPAPVQELLETALVSELSVVGRDGRVVTYPLIPLWDGERIYMTSSVLFSRKLDHVRSEPRVAVSITNPIAVGGKTGRATIQGDARVVDDDVHEGWMSVLPMWRRKEPAIDWFLGQRVALPLFFERAVIEIVPRRVSYWPDGHTDAAPQTFTEPGG